MGNFVFSGGTPKKILYNGVEVKKILFNNVEVWHKAIEAGSKSTYVGEETGTQTLSITVPDGVTKLKMTATPQHNPKPYDIESFTVTPGSNVAFTINVYDTGGRWHRARYKFNNSEYKVLAVELPLTVTVSWSEAINNS